MFVQITEKEDFMQDYSNFPPCVKDFLSHKLTIEGKSALTVKEYAYDLQTFFRYIVSKRDKKPFDAENTDITSVSVEDIRKITISDIYEYLLFLNNVLDNSVRTRARKLASIKSFYKYLNVSVHLINDNIVKDLKLPAVPKTLPRYLELDEAKDLLKSADGKCKERDILILTILLNCGLRVSELKNLKVDDIKGDTILIHGKGNKERQLYLNEATKNAFLQYIAVRKPAKSNYKQLILASNGHEISIGGIQFIVKNLIRKAGLDATKISTHKLRHTAATLMYKYGDVDVKALQEVLGHEHLNTTEIYTHANNEEIKKALKSNPLSSYKVK